MFLVAHNKLARLTSESFFRASLIFAIKARKFPEWSSLRSWKQKVGSCRYL